MQSRIVRRPRIRRRLVLDAILLVVGAEGICFAQTQPQCIPGTPWCVQGDGKGGVQVGGSAQGRAGPGGVNANANTNANANANANANRSVETQRRSGESGGRSYSSGRSRFGAGLALCATIKAGVWSGFKGGPCFAVSFRTEHLTFEMETQLLFGGVRHSVDWLFPMSFVIPLTSQPSLYEGLHLRVGGSPIGVTFAKAQNGGSYLRFGVHAGLSYEWNVSSAISWRVFDVRAFLDFGAKREVDLRRNFLDFGGQLGTGIVF